MNRDTPPFRVRVICYGKVADRSVTFSDLVVEEGACAQAFLVGPEDAGWAALTARRTASRRKAKYLDKVRNIHYHLLCDGGADGR